MSLNCEVAENLGFQFFSDIEIDNVPLLVVNLFALNLLSPKSCVESGVFDKNEAAYGKTLHGTAVAGPSSKDTKTE